MIIKQNETQKSKAKWTGSSPIKLWDGAEEKGCLCDSKKALALDHSTTDPKGHRRDKRVHVVAAGRTEASLGWALRRSKQAIPRQPTGPRLVHTGYPSTPASHPFLRQGIRSVGLTPFSPAAIKTNGVPFHSCPKRRQRGFDLSYM